MQREFQRLGIVNRGEAAMRLIHAAREFNYEFGTHIRTVALYTDPDANARFVREADEVRSLGPAMFVDPADGQRKSRYFDYTRLQEVLAEARIDAVWAGWGFVAESAEFAEFCDRLGIVFVGPDAEAMRVLGDKIHSKVLAERLGIPVVPWSGGAVETLDEAFRHASRLGFPVVIKATAGGGGRGIRVVRNEGEFAHAFESARSEALKAFGDGAVFLEKLVSGARHIEVQIIADAYGTTWAVGIRDCSVQRRNQKVIEESSSVALSEEQNQAIKEAAVRLSSAGGYRNAGTVEFLYDSAAQRFAFMEVNARLQVEHPVTEVTTGLDLVKLQLYVARGGRLEGKPPIGWGHAIEARLNAEDPDAQFTPAPGRIDLFRIAAGPGIRIDSGVQTGDQIAPEFDSMIAKIIGYGRTRGEALARLWRAVAESAVVVRGGTTNKSFLLELLERPEMIEGSVDVNWLDRLLSEGKRAPRRHACVALLEAAITVYEAESEIEREQFYESAKRGRPVVHPEVGRTVNLTYEGNDYLLGVRRLSARRYRVTAEGRQADVTVDNLGPFERRLTCKDRSYRVISLAEDITHVIEVEGASYRISRGDRGVVRAPAPAVVVAYNVKPDDQVAAGECLVILEAMKMEVRVNASFPGIVRHLMARTNVQVNTGDPLIQIEPAAEKQTAAASERVSFDAFDRSIVCIEDPAQARLMSLEELRCLLLGFDVDPAASRRLGAELSRPLQTTPEQEKDLRRREDELLEIFVDLCALFPRPSSIEDDGAAELLRAEQYMLNYLRALDAENPALPSTFVENLKRVLRHYGVTDLDRSLEIAEAMVWIHKAHLHAEHHGAPISSVLAHRLEQLTDEASGDFRGLLDRLIVVTQGRFPSVNDLARELRYVYFDRPRFDRARAQVYDEAYAHLQHLIEKPGASDRLERIRMLVECPQPLFSVLLNLLHGSSEAADAALEQLAVEIMLRRYYRIRKVESVTTGVIGRWSYATTEYEHQDRHVQVVAIHTNYGEIPAAAAAADSLLRAIDPDSLVGLDFYVWRPGPAVELEPTAGELRSFIEGIAFPVNVRRIVIAIAGPESGLSMSGLQHFTYNGENGQFVEDSLHRGLHPAMGERMRLWRLSNFQLERLPSVEDVYLFHGVARENPKDERLFAIAEVRSLDPVRDQYGNAIEFPHLERMLLEALAGIRLFQSQRASRKRLHWNRVLLYLWQPLDLRSAELNTMAHRLLRETEGLGIEQLVVRARIPDAQTRELRDTALRILQRTGGDVELTIDTPSDELLKPLSRYTEKVVRSRQLGLTYPYEIIRMLAPSRGTQSEFPSGEFVEYDLDGEGKLAAVDRPWGENNANIIVGLIRNFTDKYPEGMSRVLLLGDPSREMGSLAEAECRLIIAALDLAERLGVPLEWFTLSAGAKISMESGTENMDWISRVLRRLIEYTQAGGEVNLVVNGINVGAQPYWNAEATMLMHTRGILVMTPDGAMVLTGKRALDYSGSVSAEDNFGIGGIERVMGPNGEAQYWARDLAEATHILLRHYEHTYVIPGEHFPRRAATSDLRDRDCRTFPHGGPDFELVGDVFSNEKNPGRKKPFEIRKVMRAVSDQDHLPLERWGDWRDAEIAVVWDAHLGGYPVCMIGFESHPVARLGMVPADGPDYWTSGTLFPQASRKVARAINAASNNRPLVILANLSGFDGSPESMRKWQLEYGAEIGRAVVNFKGPIVFCVVSRYHGGAFVVFSRTLNENIESAALEGTYASVIGGAPAAAVVFAREVESRAKADNRVRDLEQQIAAADEAEKRRWRTSLAELLDAVRSEKLGEVAEEFDSVHSVQRALAVGSLDRIIPAGDLRPYLIGAVERGMGRAAETARQARQG